MKLKELCLGLLLPALPAIVSAQASAAVDADANAPATNSYSLFHPKPAGALRELSPDRPDKTDSPYTIDAGDLQIEMDFANYTLAKSDGITTKTWNLAPFNLRLGLLDNLEMQLAYDYYIHVHTEGGSGPITQSGFGDLTTRLKINLWGNDGGTTAFGLFPYIKFPTNTDHLGNNAVEGGLGLPLTLKLPGDFDLSLETAISCLHDEADSNDHADFVNSASLDHGIIGKLSGYLEFFSDHSLESHSGWVATVDTGLEYMVTDNIQIDCGCNFGVTRAADDFNPFTGITIRF